MGFYFLFVLILPSLIAAVISSPSPVSLKPYLTKLVHNEDLSKAETETVWDSFLSGNADPVMVGAILVALRSKGERSFEVAGMVRAMRKACRQVTIPGKFLDIVGTGGDGADTINISTAAAILAAACGCRIAKAGNRSVSSACGSADVLEALGIKVNMDPSEIEKCINACDIGFMFAPVNHPSMKEVAPIRRSLGVRTVFNILGPLTNAASAKHVVIGVFDKAIVPLMAQSLMDIGIIEHGIVVHGCGLDEISPLGPSTVCEIKNTAKAGAPKKYKTHTYRIDPKKFGIRRCVVEDLKGGDKTQNAEELKTVLEPGSHTNAKRDSIVLNAGVGCYVYGQARSIKEGIKLARRTLEDGGGWEKLDDWIETSKLIANGKL